MVAIARSHTLTPALWRALTLKKTHRAPATEPLLFLSQGVLHDAVELGLVTLRTIQELPTLEALVTTFIEGSDTTLTATISIEQARLYATTQDIIHQNGAYNSVIFKVVSYQDEEVVSDLYLWEVPPATAPQADESDLPLYLPKGSTFYPDPSLQDIVMDRTIRISADHQATISIRTVEGGSYSTTVPQAEAARCAVPGDYYVVSGSDELSIVYGVTAQSEPVLTPVIKVTPLPAPPPAP